MILPADDARDALLEWAKKEISSASDVRFEVAKFFLGMSTASVGFIAAAWKTFHPNDEFSGSVVWSLGTLCLTVLFAMYMFWPVFHRLTASSNIQEAHKSFVARLRGEGILWTIVWAIGIALGLYTVLAK